MSEITLCESRVRQHYEMLSNMEKKVADVVLKRGKQIPDLSTSQIAAMAGVSPATVVRFSRSIGFRGIAELKMFLGKEQLSPDTAWQTVNIEDSISVITQKDFEYNKAAIDDTLSILDMEAIGKAVDAIQNASLVGIYSEGGSASTARCAFDIFMQIDIPCQFVEDAFFQVQSASHLRAGTVAFSIIHSGAARNAIDTMRVAKENGATTIAITGTVNSPLAKLVDIPIYTGMTGHRFFSDTIAARICEFSVLSALHAALSIRNRDKLGNYRERVSELLHMKRVHYK